MFLDHIISPHDQYIVAQAKTDVTLVLSLWGRAELEDLLAQIIPDYLYSHEESQAAQPVR